MFCRGRDNLCVIIEQTQALRTHNRSNLRKANLFSELMYNVRAGSFFKASYEEDAQKTKYFLFINKHYNRNGLKIYTAIT